MEQESKIPFIINFVKEENKIEKIFTKESNESFIVSYKDIDSGACMHCDFVNPPYHVGNIHWTIPMYKGYFDFENDPSFGGLSIEVYDMNENLLRVDSFRIKNISIDKPRIDITNTESIWINYNEFFVKKIYDVVDIGYCKNVIDMGANVGLWTKYILSKGAEKVYSFEPNKRALKDLKKAFSDDERVTIFDQAIYRENTELEFFAGNNSTTSSLYDQINDGGGFTYNVKAITLDEAIKLTGEESIDLVKMDIEGAEFDVIQSISKDTFKKIKSFMIECHDYLFKEEKYKPSSIEEILKGEGYVCSMPEVNTTSKYIFAVKNPDLEVNQQA